MQVMDGTCIVRGLVGHKLMREIGLDAKLAYGAMLYRAGYDPMADVVAYCGQYNTGYVDNFMLGHLWTELGDDLIDFSCGDWQREEEWQVQVAPDGLPPITWQVEPPQYLWQKAAPLKEAWRKIGQPALGEFWYGPWQGMVPDVGAGVSGSGSSSGSGSGVSASVSVSAVPGCAISVSMRVSTSATVRLSRHVFLGSLGAVLRCSSVRNSPHDRYECARMLRSRMSLGAAFPTHAVASL